MKITIGIGLGKTSFHLVGLDERGEVVVRKHFSRMRLLRFTPESQESLSILATSGRTTARLMKKATSP